MRARRHVTSNSADGPGQRLRASEPGSSAGPPSPRPPSAYVTCPVGRASFTECHPCTRVDDEAHAAHSYRTRTGPIALTCGRRTGGAKPKPPITTRETNPPSRFAHRLGDPDSPIDVGDELTVDARNTVDLVHRRGDQDGRRWSVMERAANLRKCLMTGFLSSDSGCAGRRHCRIVDPAHRSAEDGFRGEQTLHLCSIDASCHRPNGRPAGAKEQLAITGHAAAAL
jgi:hypothetical protein